MYKIISKILVNRICLFLEEMITASQYGFVKGRRASDNYIQANEFIHDKELWVCRSLCISGGVSACSVLPTQLSLLVRVYIVRVVLARHVCICFLVTYFNRLMIQIWEMIYV